jgi:serine/threonine protein kinase
MKHCDSCRTSYPTEYTTCPKDGTPLRVISELTPGTIIRGKYQIQEKIGSGGMATVYKAHHMAFHETVALKVVSTKLVDDEAFLKRFKTEAVVTRKLIHPNAVKVEDFDTLEDGRPFMALEYVHGRSLRSLLIEQKLLPPARAVNIALQACAALGAAHAIGITHRDIKPDNILLVAQEDGSDLVKVLDFGIAKVREGVLDVGQGYTATQTGLVVGTPQYLSPEQASGKHGKDIDGRADIYALGIVLYEMLAGELPFRGDTAIALLLHHMNTVPTPVDQLRPDLGISPQLSKVLTKALEKDVNKRYATAEEFQRALQAAAPEGMTHAATMVIGSGSVVTPVTPTSAETAPMVVETTSSPAPTVNMNSGSGAPTAAMPAEEQAKVAVPVAAPTPATPVPQPQATVRTPAQATAQTKTPARLSVSAAKRPAPPPARKLNAVIIVVALVLLAGGAWMLNKSRQPQDTAPVSDDQRIFTEVRRRILEEGKLKDDNIAVAVQAKVVTLQGDARTQEESDIASALANTVEGVVGVQNLITVHEARTPKEKAPAVAAAKPASTAPAAAAPKPKEPVATAPEPAASTPDEEASQTAENTQAAQAAKGEQNEGMRRRIVGNLVKKGYQNLQNGKYRMAANNFRTALEIAPDNQNAQAGLERAQAAMQSQNRPANRFAR